MVPPGITNPREKTWPSVKKSATPHPSHRPLRPQRPSLACRPGLIPHSSPTGSRADGQVTPPWRRPNAVRTRRAPRTHPGNRCCGPRRLRHGGRRSARSRAARGGQRAPGPRRPVLDALRSSAINGEGRTHIRPSPARNIAFYDEKRYHFSVRKRIYTLRGVAQLASAPALGAGGRRFESSHPDQYAGIV